MSVDHELQPLARAAAAGNRDSLEQLLAELRPAVVRTARLVVGPGSWAAEDAAQDALVDIARHIGSLREPASVRAWALKIAVSRAIKVARRERLRPVSLWSIDDIPSLAYEREGFDEDLRSAFYRLPPKMRAIAILRLYAGFTETETAELASCSVGTVKSQLHEARQRLAQQIATERKHP